jgi:hypothetical protein
MTDRVAPRQSDMLERILKTWLFMIAVLFAPILPLLLTHRAGGLTSLFLITQDCLVVMGILAVVALLRLVPGLAKALMGGFRAWAALAGSRATALARHPLRVVLGLALLCGVIGWAGGVWVYDGYALSMDEVMARFGATIIGHGQFAAPLDPAWRAYADALSPRFLITGESRAWWTSGYLPVNSAFQALGAAANVRALVNPLLAAVSVVAVFGVGRRLWPDRPNMALGAAILLATSSQLLVTSMTSYAMTAHLALNLVWLWLFLRGDRPGCLGALAVGFLACGLHQLAFHPLFVAPFILQLWLDRRWRLAAVYTLGYGVICLFWMDYWRLLAAVLPHAPAGVAQAQAGAYGAAGGYWAQVVGLVRSFTLDGVNLMACNLIRFVTWQNLLVAPLVVLGAGAAVRAGGVMRSLLLGLLLTVVVVLVVEPYQGHGWGYRYLHGLLGSACLLAAWTWTRFADGLTAEARPGARLAFVAMAAISLLLLFPIRAWQTHAFVHPYATAHAAIERAKTPFVIVDDTGTWFGVDLVRNDPYLRNRPIVLYLEGLTDAQLRAVCARGAITLFDRADAARAGIRTFPQGGTAPADANRLNGFRALSCGQGATPVRDFAGAPIRASTQSLSR